MILQKQLSVASARPLAQTYACLGDADRALDYLDALFKKREAGLPEILQAPELAWMWPNARFAALRKNVNLAR